MTDQDLINQFLATNDVTRVPEKKCAYKPAEIGRAVRGETPVEKGPRLAATDHLGQETWVNDEGEVIYHG